jgi:acyl-CoA oxidase
MQQILEAQRAKSKINPQQLAELIYRGKYRYETIMEYLEISKKNGTAPDPRVFEMSRDQMIAHGQKIYHNLRTKTELNVLNHEIPTPELIVMTNCHSPGSIGLFMGTSLLNAMGDDEQVSKWHNKIAKSVISCCYAQTELGTGSDVQNLKTLAVFDPKTQEFEFHSPSIESIKWWPGDLGVSCNYAVVFARLISNGKDHGVQSFFVQLRDLTSHVPLPGVEVGDIGPKLGFNTKDNGFLKFTRHRAPRSSLLCRYITIDSDGSVKTRGDPKAMYTAMMDTRTALAVCAYSALFKAVTIATRYSLFRTQFKDSKGNYIPIFNYQMQRDKLFKELARCYTMNLAVTTGLKQIVKNAELSKKGNFSELQSTHIILCCFKSLFTSWEADGYANLIKACGGHGYSQYSGLPFIFTEQFSHQILEGDNSVLLLQATRYLIKCFARLQKGNTKKIVGYFEFVINYQQHMEREIPEDPICTDLSSIISMFRRSVCYQLQRLGMKLFALNQEHKDAKKVWDTLTGVENHLLGKTFAVQLILEAAQKSYEAIAEPAIKTALQRLLQLQAINLAEEHANLLLMAGALTQGHTDNFVKRKLELIEEISPDALVLAEGMQWPDEFLNSAIGSSDKNPYETLYSWAKSIGQLNQYTNQVHPAVLEYQMKVAKHREQRL